MDGLTDLDALSICARFMQDGSKINEPSENIAAALLRIAEMDNRTIDGLAERLRQAAREELGMDLRSRIRAAKAARTAGRTLEWPPWDAAGRFAARIDKQRGHC